jgi:Spy/CpxP family protein refolding chaperone
MLRKLAILSMLVSLSLFGQAAKAPWWSGQTIRELNLTPEQTRAMRATMKEFRPRLQELHAAVQSAEQDLETEFSRDPIDAQKANAVIERLVTARTGLTRTLSQMGLKLRVILTAQQWQEVERRFPPKTAAKPGT